MQAVSDSEASENLKSMIYKVVANRAPLAITASAWRGRGAGFSERMGVNREDAVDLVRQLSSLGIIQIDVSIIYDLATWAEAHAVEVHLDRAREYLATLLRGEQANAEKQGRLQAVID